MSSKGMFDQSAKINRIKEFLSSKENFFAVNTEWVRAGKVSVKWDLKDRVVSELLMNPRPERSALSHLGFTEELWKKYLECVDKVMNEQAPSAKPSGQVG